ncbi:hypothetical protein I302_106847 [Kwoniella bestiolae CBS 10118]|uniref:Uncharacterized protein n=1 Tax=Kwoniella bestiolae CBS 10118 TaxID=1296100 RepID=A0AAJ8KCL5_9TREE
MSSNELIPLFPSATHPAIPISAQILSTLRNLTGPGKGNDLKPEERAALVGVSALLGCEKIQSKDLPLSSAQKASSVSPRPLPLDTLKMPHPPRIHSFSIPGGSPSKKSSTGTSTGTSLSVPEDHDIEESTTPSGHVRPEDVLSPLQTPKKKYKFSSGLDISSLVKSPRTPRNYDSVIASPLRQSVTRQPSTVLPKDHAQPPEEDSLDGERTPSKKNKFTSTPIVGVDLEHPPPVSAIKSVQKRRKGEDPSAFFALRPGMGSASNTPIKVGDGEEGEGWMHRRPEETHRKNRLRRVEGGGERGRKRRKEVRKVDWTYKESVWGNDVDEKGELNRIWKDLDIWLEKNDMPSIENTEIKGSDGEDILLKILG